jgi:hypothetical protein
LVENGLRPKPLPESNPENRKSNPKNLAQDCMPSFLYLRGAVFVREVVFACFLLLAPAALAVLGGDVSSIGSDRIRTGSQVRVLAGSGYSIHELQAPTGTTIREFVSPRGEVFAVAWQGPSAPDLHQLLGDYFDTYVHAWQAAPGARRRGRHVDTGDLVVESGGHMRFITGRAYLRSKLPDGVRPDAIH